MAEIEVTGGIVQIDSDTSDMQNPGAICRIGPKVYRLSKAGASFASSGAECLLQLDSVSGTTGYTVESILSSTTGLYGVNATGASVSTGEYFWAQVAGPFAIDSDMTTDSAIAINRPVYIDANLVMNSVAAGISCGMAMNAIATNAAGVVYLCDCTGNM